MIFLLRFPIRKVSLTSEIPSAILKKKKKEREDDRTCGMRHVKLIFDLLALVLASQNITIINKSHHL